MFSQQWDHSTWMSGENELHFPFRLLRKVRHPLRRFESNSLIADDIMRMQIVSSDSSSQRFFELTLQLGIAILYIDLHPGY